MSETALSIGFPRTRTEREAIVASQEGDREAFGMLVKTYMRRAYGAALGLTGNREDALDASQEAFVRAWRAIRRFDVRRPFYPWLYRIVRNLSFDLLRRRRVRPMDGILGEHASPGAGPEILARREEVRSAVRDAIHRLPDRDREILTLRHFRHLSYREIAAALEIPQGTVMSRLFTARKRLRAELSDRFEGGI